MTLLRNTFEISGAACSYGFGLALFINCLSLEQQRTSKICLKDFRSASMNKFDNHLSMDPKLLTDNDTTLCIHTGYLTSSRDG